MEDHKIFKQRVKAIYAMLLGVFALFIVTAFTVIYLISNPDVFEKSKPEAEDLEIIEEEDYDKIENGIHVRTGLVEAEGLMAVVNNCTNCHSAKLVTQNRMNKERWISTIRWMQETQNLWDLGTNENIIVDYLVANYPPAKKGRREVLKDIGWYVLKE
ncbi:MAG: monoheme cytochrome C [Maribacter sp.]|nr:monoheme cytochrome C [Maribacter sp.]